MTQQPLFSPASPRLHAKADPPTSRLAARELVASGAHDTQLREVLDALRSYSGCTSAELAVRCKLNRHLVARRLPDLEKRKLARKLSVRGCRISGKSAVTWEAIA